MNARYHVTCKVCYVETNEVTKKGKAKLAPIYHRHLYLIDPKPLFANESGDYRIVVKGPVDARRYTISQIPMIEQSCWTNPNGKCETWYIKAKDYLEQDEEGNVYTVRPFVRTKDKAMDEAGIIRWLSYRLGLQGAKVAVEQLLTAEPENQQKLAA